MPQAISTTSSNMFGRLYLWVRHLKWSRSFSWLNSTGLAVAMTVLIWLGIAAKYYENREADFADAQQDVRNFTLLFEENVVRSIGELDKALLYLRRTIQSSPEPLNFHSLIGTSDVLSDLIVQVAIIDANGIMRASNIGPQPAPPTDLSDREHYRVHASTTADRLFISKPVIGRASGRWSVQMTRRFSKPDGSFEGVIVASFDPEHFAKFYGRIELGRGATFTLIGTDGVVRATGGDKRFQYPLGKVLTSHQQSGYANTDQTVTFIDAATFAETPRLVVVRKVSGHPLLVSTSIPEQTIYRSSNSSLYWMLLAGSVLSMMIGMSTWHTREANRQLQRNAIVLKLTLEHMTQGITMVTKDLEIPVINRQCIQLLDLPPQFLTAPPRFDELVRYQQNRGEFGNADIGDDVDPLDVFGPNDTARKFNMYERTRPDGTAIEVRTTRLIDGGFVRTFTDITWRRQAQTEAHKLACEDALTGLANRRVLTETIDRLTASSNYNFGVLCLDLDRFKNVNDTMGHAVGDQLLKAVAGRLRASLRSTDLVARLGGDEFAVVLSEIKSARTCRIVVQRLVEAIGRPYDIDGRQILIGTSIGVAVGPADGQSTNDLLIAADLALYAAKAAGRGRYQFFAKEMNEEIKARQTIEGDLRIAITEQQLELHYQPIVNLKDNTVVGFEALARWTHPVKGAIAPDKFIPIAEETGLILVLGEWALREACSQAMKWPCGIGVAVNLSPLQFGSADLVKTVETILLDTGLPASRLELEITEGLLMRNTERTVAILHGLRKLGVRIAMDDFGTGFSSLSYLQSFPFDRIKVDRSFVSKLGASASAASVIKAVVEIAAASGMQTTAEGVETEEQRAKLEALGYHEAQGYLFSRPLPLAQVAGVIAVWQRREVQVAA